MLDRRLSSCWTTRNLNFHLMFTTFVVTLRYWKLFSSTKSTSLIYRGTNRRPSASPIRCFSWPMQTRIYWTDKTLSSACKSLLKIPLWTSRRPHGRASTNQSPALRRSWSLWNRMRRAGKQTDLTWFGFRTRRKGTIGTSKRHSSWPVRT